MKLEFDGRVWDLDTEHITFRHALAIQKQTGMSIADWEDSLDFKRDDEKKILNPPAEWLTSVGALYWLMAAQNGEQPDPDTMDFDFTAFLQAYFAALMAEIEKRTAAAEAEPDPTSPSPDGPPSSIPPALKARKSPVEGAAIAS